MFRSHAQHVAALAPLVATLAVGCQNLPGSDEQQGAVGGGAAGAVIGQAAGGSLLSTLLGGAAGAGAGYLIGANKDKILDKASGSDDAQQSVQEAQADPATVEDVADADTADLNGDGFVTIDEVEAMNEAGLDDEEMIDRLQATDQVFELNQDQQSRLVDAGVSPSVVAKMNDINQQQREQIRRESEVISKNPDQT